ncbi:golgin subfamily A member 6-like protein 22 [Littorina saxatilis]|uniref:golgin subfamily A member 6-like protein 22 n=1 Tax=Littorina saxatilis TaxID=31220 RepID=UPI0038B65F1B
MVDYATRYVEATPLKDIRTETVSEALWVMWTKVGIPREVLTDRGSQFTSEVMEEVNKLLNIKGIHTTPWHPQTNGLTEKFNSTLKHMMKKLCQEQPKDWDKFLPALLFANREVPQESLKFSPFELLYGREVRGPMQILRQVWTNEDTADETRSTVSHIVDLTNKIEKTCETAKNNLSKAALKYTKTYNKKTKERSLAVGDKVLLLLPEKHNKLQLTWKGPYPVVEKVGSCNYRVKIKGRDKLLHANLLKLYVERESESKENRSEQTKAKTIVEVPEINQDQADLLQNQSRWIRDQASRLQDQDIRLEDHEERLQIQDSLLKNQSRLIQDKVSCLKDQDGRLQDQDKRLGDYEKRLQIQDSLLQNQSHFTEDQASLLKDHDSRLQDLAGLLKIHSRFNKNQASLLKDHDSRLQDQDTRLGDHEERLQIQDSLLQNQSRFTQDQASLLKDHDSRLQDLAGLLKKQSRFNKNRASRLKNHDRRLHDQTSLLQNQSRLMEDKASRLQDQDKRLRDHEERLQIQDSLLKKQSHFNKNQASLLKDHESRLQDLAGLLQNQSLFIQDQTSLLQDQDGLLKDHDSRLGRSTSEPVTFYSGPDQSS